MMVCCFAFGCSHRTLRESCSFYRFPPDRTKRLLWTILCRRGDRVPGPGSRLCSCHFVNGTRKGGLEDPVIFAYNERMPTERKLEYIICCVPGCKSVCPKNIENFLVDKGHFTQMFPAPRSDRALRQWKYALKRMGRELNKDDHICELHFHEIEIERSFVTKTSDGSTIEIAKRVPTLKSAAIPSLLLDLPVIETRDLIEKIQVVQNASKVEVSEPHIITVNSNESCNTSNISCDNWSFPAEKQETSPMQKCLSFQEVLKNIHSITRPNTYWSAVCTDEFIIFARWNNKFNAEKRIVVEKDFTMRVYLKEWEMNVTDLMDISSIADISQLLEKVESYNLS